jgi:hypothetical protein
VTSDDDHSHDGSVNIEEAKREWKKQLDEKNNGPNTEEMMAIHEASPQISSAKRGKCRAGDADADISSKAGRLKALQNEGDKTSLPTIFNIANSSSVSNFHSIGISLGANACSVSKVVCDIKHDAESSTHRQGELIGK